MINLTPADVEKSFKTDLGYKVTVMKAGDDDQFHVYNHDLESVDWYFCNGKSNDKYGNRIISEWRDPVKETVTYYGWQHGYVWSLDRTHTMTHKFSYDTIDGEPDVNSIAMEKLNG